MLRNSTFGQYVHPAKKAMSPRKCPTYINCTEKEWQYCSDVWFVYYVSPITAQSSCNEGRDWLSLYDFLFIFVSF